MNKLRGKKVYILSPRSGGPLSQNRIIEDQLKKRGVNVFHYNNFWGWLKMHFIYGKNNYILTDIPFLLRFCKKNFILNIHGNFHIEKDLLKNPLGYLYPLNIRWSEKIVTPSIYLKEVLNLKSAIVINNSLDKKNLPGRKSFYKEGNEINLIMVTSFDFREKAYGVISAVEAVSKVKSDKRIFLDIYGGGKFLKNVENDVKRIYLPNNISLSLHGKSNDLEEKYASSDIFIYWSNLDNMPIVFLEAMHFGLPIVANNFPSFGEILGKENLISLNKEEFTSNIENLIKNPSLRERLGLSNLKRIKKYRSEKIVDDWIKTIFDK